MFITGAFYAVGTVARIRGGGELAAPIAFGVAACCSLIMIAAHLRWWDEVRSHLDIDG
jgi:hypothetical protein